jgi:hypothetical protein
VFSGELQGECFYRASPESIQWIKKSSVLRFTAVCIEGDDNDLEITIQFTKTGITLKYDLQDDGPVSVPMNWFEGPSGILLDHRNRIEFLSVLIKS